MFFAASRLIFLLALSTTGLSVEVRNSAITLPVTRTPLHSFSGTVNLLQHDRARAAAFKNRKTHRRRDDGDDVPGPSDAWVYTAPLAIGNPPQTYNLIIDADSSNTWVGASTPYKPTNTSIDTQQPVDVTYADGLVDSPSRSTNMYCMWLHDLRILFTGTIYLDTVTVGDRLTVNEFQLGVATESHNIGYDSILGIGPEALSRGTLKDDLTAKIPTYTDYLYNQGKIGQNIVSIFFQPSTADPGSAFGELTFGDVDYTKFTGNIVYTPITAALASKNYWGINLSITYGSTEILFTTAGIIDAGSPFIYIASDAYVKYQAVTGATFDPATDLLRISPDQYRALRSLDFHIDGEIFSLTPNAQIWTRSLNHRLRGAAENGIYLIVTDYHSLSGQGHDFLNGYPFIQRFYVVLDSSHSRVGFATTRFTNATTN
ncbi:acid protease [Suillus decipiens]|nr:acid protease [Suillus decipiens]